jgi:hypothetical protein
MVLPIVTPELQWSDANGKPYAAGTITSYVVGTTTPKATYADPGMTAANPNPLVLDSAGRSLMYGDGDFRLLLHDAAGNLIFDIPATTIVSAAMQPVVVAPTLADARLAMGIDDAIATEAATLNAAIAAEAQTRATGDTSLLNQLNTDIANEATTRSAADATLTANLNAEIARATAAEAALGGGTGGGSTQGTTRAGHATADSGGNITAAFSPAFPNGVAVVLLGRADLASPLPVASATTLSLSLSSWSAQLLDGSSAPIPGGIVYWYAIGW